MYNMKYEELIAHETDNVYETYWNFCKSRTITIVLDEKNKFVGVIGNADWEKAVRSGVEQVDLSNIVNRNCAVISEKNPYAEARNVYAEKNIEYLPVVDKEGNFADLFSRRRALYKQYLTNGNLPYLYYAKLVYASALQAKKLGYDAISVIEFGVAGGNGLLSLQFHAREISKLLGIEIQVYGFDSGEGLVKTEETYLDMPFWWQPGFFKMDYKKLEKKLDNTQLIIGDVNNTCKNFFEEHKPAPVAAVMVDVDLYSSTVPVLNMLDTDYDNVLPRILMFFDDVMKGYECLGENVAIKEFNKQHEGSICISPEGTEQGFRWLNGENQLHQSWAPDGNDKVCHYFKHPKYKELIREVSSELPLTLLDL